MDRPEGGLIGSAIHIAYRACFPDSELQLVFNGKLYKPKELIVLSPNILVDNKNTQPLYKLAGHPSTAAQP
jgi:hypothetical protein